MASHESSHQSTPKKRGRGHEDKRKHHGQQGRVERTHEHGFGNSGYQDHAHGRGRGSRRGGQRHHDKGVVDSYQSHENAQGHPQDASYFANKRVQVYNSPKSSRSQSAKHSGADVSASGSASGSEWNQVNQSGDRRKQYGKERGRRSRGKREGTDYNGNNQNFNGQRAGGKGKNAKKWNKEERGQSAQNDMDGGHYAQYNGYARGSGGGGGGRGHRGRNSNPSHNRRGSKNYSKKKGGNYTRKNKSGPQPQGQGSL